MWFSAAIAMFVMSAAPAATAPNDLSWLSGDWVAATGERWTEEHWSQPRAGEMMGYSRSGRGGTARDFEFLRIAADADGTLAYFAQPQGRAPTRFKLTSSSATEAIFENPTHDYPTRIVYRRNGTTLTATISGPEGSKSHSWTYQRR